MDTTTLYRSQCIIERVSQIHVKASREDRERICAAILGLLAKKKIPYAIVAAVIPSHLDTGKTNNIPMMISPPRTGRQISDKNGSSPILPLAKKYAVSQMTASEIINDQAAPMAPRLGTNRKQRVKQTIVPIIEEINSSIW